MVDHAINQVPSDKILSKYKLTARRYVELLDRQGGGCALCGKKPNDQRLVVDHDHSCCDRQGSCGKCVRGLLCTACNTRLGVYESITESIRVKMESYLDYKNSIA